MYRIRVTKIENKETNKITEGYVSYSKAVNRFNFLCSQKKSGHIYLEELKLNEYKVHRKE